MSTVSDTDLNMHENLSEEEAKLLSDLKYEFITYMSHNLRTPLACIKVAATMLRKVKDEDTRQRYLDILEEECDKEIELINDLLANYEEP